MNTENENKNVSMDNRYLHFRIGNEMFAFPLLTVKEVIGFTPVKSVPNMPAHFLGFMQLRENVLPVLDLRKKLNIKPLESKETVIIICDVDGKPLGVVVDAVISVLSPAPSDMTAPPSVNGQKPPDFITSVYKSSEGLVLVLELSTLVSNNNPNLLNSLPKAA